MLLEPLDQQIRNDFDTLLNFENKPAVSIYMPTLRVTDSNRQDPIRLKNALQKTQNMLKDENIDSLSESIKSAHELLDDREFWQHQSNGLALFISEDHFRYYRLPINFEEKVILSNRYYLKPLIPFLNQTMKFFVLPFTRNHTALYEGTAYSIHPIAEDELPTSMDDALSYLDKEKSLQFHTSAQPNPTSSRKGGNERAAMYHGQGVTNDPSEEEIKIYARYINEIVVKHLQNENAPLLVAADEAMFPIYQDVNTYPHLYPTVVGGNPDIMKPGELHAKTWQVIEPHFQQRIDEAKERFNNTKHTDNASDELEQVVSAAIYHKVDTLMVAKDVDQWGIFDPDAQRIQTNDAQTSNNYDLLDLAAVHTLKNGGIVYSMLQNEIPHNQKVAAILRYS